MSHLKGFSPEWTLAWFFRCVAWLKQEPQMSHLYGFSPVCILRWFQRVLCRANFFSHTSHTYGLSPEWILSWFFKWGDWENCIPQTLHLKKRRWFWQISVILKIFLGKLYIVSSSLNFQINIIKTMLYDVWWIFR